MGEPIPPTPATSSSASDAVSPVTLASAYATLAADGKLLRADPDPVGHDQDKKSLPVQTPPASQVFDPDVANGADQVLIEVMTNGTGTGNQLDGTVRPPARPARPTATTQSWFVGYTPQLATAVWVGTPDQSRRRCEPHPRRHVLPGTSSVPRSPPRSGRASWTGASKGLPVRDFADPSDKILEGDRVAVPYVGGLSVARPARPSRTPASAVSAGTTVSSTLLAAAASSGTSPVRHRALRGFDVHRARRAGYVPRRRRRRSAKTPHGPEATPTPKATPSPKAHTDAATRSATPSPTTKGKQKSKPGPKPKATSRP